MDKNTFTAPQGKGFFFLPDRTGNISCDNVCAIYADGEYLQDDNGDWKVPTALAFHELTKVIGTHPRDTGHAAAFIASFSNGVATDKSWKCSNTHYPGWSAQGFDDSTWPAAVEHGVNGGGLWKTKLEGIATSAQWIWTANIWGDDEVYCRVRL